MISKSVLLLVCALFSACNCAFVDKLTKCPYNDESCFKNLIQNILTTIGKSGVPELNIPPIDPIVLKNVTVSILGLINVTLIDGVANGVKNCIIDRIDFQIENGSSKFEVTCDVTIESKFSVKGVSPTLQNLFGSGLIHGDGNAKVKLDKVHIVFEFFYHFYKKEDGDVYSKTHRDEYRYDYSIGKMQLSADKIFLGENDATDAIVGFLNENWKSLMDKFGKAFFDVAMNICYDYLHSFFDATPTKYYIAEDVEHLVKNKI